MKHIFHIPEDDLDQSEFLALLQFLERKPTAIHQDEPRNRHNDLQVRDTEPRIVVESC